MRTEQLADKWLKENGIEPDALLKLDMHLLQAQRIAHNLLKHHAKGLEQNEIETLNTFLKAMAHANKRNRLTPAHCYKVMNIGTAANRKLFRKHRHAKKIGHFLK